MRIDLKMDPSKASEITRWGQEVKLALAFLSQHVTNEGGRATLTITIQRKKNAPKRS